MLFFFAAAAFAGENDFVSTDYSDAPQQILFEGHVAAPPAAVWAVLSDHEGMTEWMPKLGSVALDNTNAESPGQVGCERSCSFAGRPVNESIVWWDEGVGYGYTVNDGPVENHVGVVRISDDGSGGTDVVWEQYFDITSMKSRMMRRMMPKLLDEALGNMEAQLQAEGGNS